MEKIIILSQCFVIHVLRWMCVTGPGMKVFVVLQRLHLKRGGFFSSSALSVMPVLHPLQQLRARVGGCALWLRVSV